MRGRGEAVKRGKTCEEKSEERPVMASFQLFARHGPGHLGNKGCAAKEVKTRGEGKGGGEDDGNQGRRGKQLFGEKTRKVDSKLLP